MIDFKQYKEQVSVEQVVLWLGYRFNPAAGKGRYREYVLTGPSGTLDTLVVSGCTGPKAGQLWMRRDGSRGDAIDLINANAQAFGGGKGVRLLEAAAAKLGNVLMPTHYAPPERTAPDGLNADRYDVKPLSNPANAILAARGLTRETVKAFMHTLVEIRDRESRSAMYNVGFPYRRPGETQDRGYEIRGYGSFKAKAEGTDSTSAAWMADFSGGNPDRICFFESALDAMAYWQCTHLSADLGGSALVSIGGTFSNLQVKTILDRWPQAQAVECFDNDPAGQLYGARLAAIANGLSPRTRTQDGTLFIDCGNGETAIAPGSCAATALQQALGLPRSVLSHRPPAHFKDWNDCLRGITAAARPEPPVTKHDRDNALYTRRNR